MGCCGKGKKRLNRTEVESPANIGNFKQEEFPSGDRKGAARYLYPAGAIALALFILALAAI